MAARPFESISELLPQVEALVLEAHRRWYESQGGTDWSPPTAYRWLRYEDPDPVGRLCDGVRRLPDAYEPAALAALERRVAELERSVG